MSLDAAGTGPDRFYDDLAPYFDLIFPDWEASMARQGEAIDRLIAETLPAPPGGALRVLDVAAGIGTQALPLAARGFQVTARDVSARAIERLAREAAARRLSVDAGVADMGRVGATVAGAYDVVLAMDNAVPHLLTDDDLAVAFRQFLGVLRAGGAFVCSVRDYDRIDPAAAGGPDYGERRRGDQVFRLRQEWTWIGKTHYDMTFVIEEQTPQGLTPQVRATTRYHAIGTSRLLELMAAAGFSACRRRDGVFYQPVLLGRRGA